jgi:antitoxin component YwqK of YwqJK toxin-antitoxin module
MNNLFLASQKTFFAFVALTILSFSNFTCAQSVEKVTLNGKTYFVYPTRQGAFTTIIVEKTKEEIRAEFDKNYGEITMSPEEREFTYKDFEQELSHSYASKYEMKAMNANPLAFISVFYNDSRDIEPSLDPLPDGDYIQYFEKIDIDAAHKDVCKGIIAGKFSLKNNQLEGSAIWFSQFGDSVKYGTFENGVKQGLWVINALKGKNNFYADYKKSYKEAKAIKSSSSTLNEYQNYNEGILNGAFFVKDHGRIIEEGFYKDGEKSGTWREYALLPPKDSVNIKMKIYNDYQMGRGEAPFLQENWYALAIPQLVSERVYWDVQPIHRGIFVRSTANANMFYNQVRGKATDELYQKVIDKKKAKIEVYDSLLPFNFHNKPSIYFSSNMFFSINYPVAEGEEGQDGLQLGREYYDNYEGYEEYGGYEQDYSDYAGGEYFQPITTNKLMDSLGYKPMFKSAKEFYINGTKKYEFDFTDSTRFNEDTIYYSNGKPFSIVSPLKDSNQYCHKIYDMNGKLYANFIHDSIGEYIRESEGNIVTRERYDQQKSKTINGIKYTFDPYQKTLTYHARDTMEKVNLTAATLIYELRDSTGKYPILNQWFYPNTRTLTTAQFSLFGDTVSSTSYYFSEDYNNYRVKGASYFGDLVQIEEGNAGFDVTNHSRYTYYHDSIKAKLDSLPQARITYMNELYDLTQESLLLFKGQPFTGKVNFKTSKKDYKLTASNTAIAVRICNSKKWTKKVLKAFELEQKGQKTKLHNELKTSVAYINEFYDPIQSSIVSYAAAIGFQYETTEYNFKNANDVSVSGNYLNGKPDGNWVAKNGQGKVLRSAFYKDGELDGKYSTYKIAQKPKKVKKRKNDEYGESYDGYSDEMNSDTLPKKPVYYLFETTEYKNSKREGLSTTYDWLGNITQRTSYKDNEASGPAFEKTKYSKTTMSYAYGQLDGLVTTKIKLSSKRDSIMLYELNFKDGQLQGESRSYHPGGLLAKRGFFLGGQPIDDYEAYDTLGFKYHYVKFLYSFPVEEKIYEANSLSVKYLYDWKDSINFVPDGFEMSQGLERIYAQEGLMNRELNRAYMGRQSLIEKTDLSYDMIKYFPNDTISRYGSVENQKNVGCWHFQNYDGLDLYEIDYFDTLIKVNGLIFKSKGIYRGYDEAGNTTHLSYIIERNEKYDCSHSDYYEKRQFMTIQDFGKGDRMNGYAKNYYDNGTLQSEGQMKNGLPTGIWKMYENDGSLNEVGEYKQGKRNGRWLKGDLSKTNYMGDICLNPNLPNLEEKLAKEAKRLDVSIIIYLMGKAKDQSNYEMDLNEEK